MNAILNRRSHILVVSLSPLLLVSPSPAHADIFQWEYINPADPGQGKRQSTTLAPDGAGVDAVLGADLPGRNLHMAYLIGAYLSDIVVDCPFGCVLGVYAANLADTNLSGADLTNASLQAATLTNADFTGAEVRGAKFGTVVCFGSIGCADGGTGLALAQLYSTASYQSHDLTGIGLAGNDLSGGNFAAQNLTNANFSSATLTDANFAGAEVRGASFYRRYGTGITLVQLYSTASYQTHDLSGIGLLQHNLAGGNFAGQSLINAAFGEANLTGANFHDANLANADFTFYYCASECGMSPATLTGANLSQANLSNTNFDRATLTDADLTGADVRGANFRRSYFSSSGEGIGGGITLEQLYSAASYYAHDLGAITLAGNYLAGGNFAGQNLVNAKFDSYLSSVTILTGANLDGADAQGANFYGATLEGANLSAANLTNADFSYATLTDADFTGAEVRGANFAGLGITLAQLYSTASYRARDLSEITLYGQNLASGDFAGQNLTNANFGGADLTGANFRDANLTNAALAAYLTAVDFTAADARGAQYLDVPVSAITTNLIRPDGHIKGLDLDGDGLLVVRDYDGDSRYDPARSPIAITVDQHVTIGLGGALRMVFEADAWDSTISFARDIPVTLGGTLELTFAADVNLASQVGRTLRLFDWTGVNSTGAFTIASSCAWDVSKLYTTGEVTLTAIPEPASIVLAAAGAFSLTFYRRRKFP